MQVRGAKDRRPSLEKYDTPPGNKQASSIDRLGWEQRAGRRFVLDDDGASILGMGSFGVVRAAFDKDTGQRVAIKSVSLEGTNSCSPDNEISVLSQVAYIYIFSYIVP